MDFPLPSVSVRRLLAVALGLAAVLVIGARHFGGSGHAGPVVAPVRVAKASAPAVQKLVVDVAGAVARPGLYHLGKGTRIADAVAAAGGATSKAELDYVNLAAPLADGEQVVVPARGATGAPAETPPAAGSSPTAPLDLNSASAEQLDALPGIGPATAQKIVDYRTAHGPFHSVEELDAVPGIGAGRIAQLKGLVIP
ncbi:MAG TPA: ComEA family DNA-binding protein [Gaiellaceae bacterium]|nr:ComEA family DNA-binding protein [Gaiellaceae bacterium]